MFKKNKFGKNIKNKSVIITTCLLLVFVLSVILGKTGVLNKIFPFMDFLDTGYTREEKEVEGLSTAFTNSTPGGLKITKKAEWTAYHEATVTFNLDSVEIPRNINRDIILVLDLSESMDEGRISSLKDAVTNLTNDLFSNSNNRLAIVTFGTTSSIDTNFTNNVSVINNILSNLEIKGATNYYLALKDVQTIMSSYSRKSNTDVHMIFVTDGYATDGLGLYQQQYKTLKQKYPYLISTGIQLEMGESIANDVKNISDYQYYSFLKNIKGNKSLKSVLFDAARPAEYYNSIKFTDNINSEYFIIDSNQNIDVPFGDVEIVSDGQNQKFIWNVPAGKIKSGSSIQYLVSYKLKLKENMYDKETFFPLTRSNNFTYSAKGISSSASIDVTNVLKSWYVVNYNPNIPLGCSLNYSKTGNYAPFESVSMDGGNLSCFGYQFKGWEVTDSDAKIISSDYFIMPSHDAVVGAKWTSLNIDKSMSGTISTRSTLYQTIAAKAVPDNQKSTFVKDYSIINYYDMSSDTNGKGVYTDSSSIGTTYPIHFYRGNVTDNNVIFGGFCWKIVRTTSTGGVKIIYNGKPSNGQCLAQGVDTTIGFSAYNDFPDDESFSYINYMYDDVYPTETTHYTEGGWYAAAGLTETYRSDSEDFFSNSILVSSSYSFDGTKFKVAGNKYSLNATQGIENKYTVWVDSSLSNAENYYSTSAIFYITRVDTTEKRVYYIKFDAAMVNEAQAAGKDVYTYFYEKGNSTKWVFGHDVSYSNGTYTLLDTIQLSPNTYGNNIAAVNGTTKRHYTCFSTSNQCSTVSYVFADNERYMFSAHINLSNGEKIDSAVNKMLENDTYTTSSTVKNEIDVWFDTYMDSEDILNNLEDTLWCTNRNTFKTGGWLNTGDSREFMEFEEWSNNGFSFDCAPEDSFTVSDSNGNGALTYPVGLLTITELNRAGSYHDGTNTSFYLYNNLDYFTMTPTYYNNITSYVSALTTSGNYNYIRTRESAYIRPVVSLKPGIYVADGTGYETDPYVIE